MTGYKTRIKLIILVIVPRDGNGYGLAGNPARPDPFKAGSGLYFYPAGRVRVLGAEPVTGSGRGRRVGSGTRWAFLVFAGRAEFFCPGWDGLEIKPAWGFSRDGFPGKGLERGERAPTGGEGLGVGMATVRVSGEPPTPTRFKAGWVFILPRWSDSVLGAEPVHGGLGRVLPLGGERVFAGSGIFLLAGRDGVLVMGRTLKTLFNESFLDQILYDTGFFFTTGVVGSSTWNFLKGVCNSPRGMRLVGGSQAVRMNALRSGGSMAVFGCLVNASECSMAYIRQKEDPWNSIIGNAAICGFHLPTEGFPAVTVAAALGAALTAAAICGFHLRQERFPAVTVAAALGAALSAAVDLAIIMTDKNEILQKKETSSRKYWQ
ncbi:hypothetical protein H6P81_008876 [Aristolochia fimbriata]|uniref:Uncharacterized protein n=1 Tax=Aristolochia fimbriata TaxID=158543 RepID=A0AAV7EKH9_ARIFI|nr:hypothetical protein H6P81_008876 [Aristolochia fimbriata]